jgi:hypothetical protein
MIQFQLSDTLSILQESQWGIIISDGELWFNFRPDADVMNFCWRTDDSHGPFQGDKDGADKGIAITDRYRCSTSAAQIVMWDISELILGYHEKYLVFNNNTVKFLLHSQPVVLKYTVNEDYTFWHTCLFWQKN